MKSVFICEDHQIVIDGIVHILEQSGQYEPVLAFKTASTFLHALESESPDIIILDLNLPDRNSLNFIADIRRDHPDVCILILTMHNDPLLAEKVREEGANGYLLKDFGEKELLYALNVVFSGGYYTNPEIEQRHIENSSTKALFLTKREKEVIAFTAQGKSSSEIAEHLFLSPHTVNTHRRNIYKKLGISNVKELITFAYANGLS